MHILKRKLHKLYEVFQSAGLLGALILILQFIEKHTRDKSREAAPGSIYTVARYNDILWADLTHPPLQQNRPPKSGALEFAWIMPPPGKGSGGHMNMFRFIQFLENAGHKNSIYLYVDGKHGTIADVVASMGDSYPDIKAGGHSMRWLDNDTKIPSSIDGIFCSSWETAYASFNQEVNAKRFYFVQDFEPYFYPIGALYTLAENTYRMGFMGVTAGGWLKKKLHEEYGMLTDSFDFGADTTVYKHTNSTKRTEIFYYARPYTARRGFEMGILALDLFHKKHPDYTINIVGWDVSDYDIPFPYVNNKILEIDELSDMYNRCAAGLVLSYTNMSLLPLELLACGTIPVVNDAENNRLVSNNDFIAYTENTPHALAARLSYIIENKNQIDFAKQASQSVQENSWGLSGSRFVDIIEKAMHGDK